MKTETETELLKLMRKQAKAFEMLTKDFRRLVQSLGSLSELLNDPAEDDFSAMDYPTEVEIPKFAA